MKKKNLVISILCVIAFIVIAQTPSFASSSADLGTNGKVAKSLYGITSDDRILIASSGADSDEINSLLDQISHSATSSNMSMVYVPSGNHAIYSSIRIPSNVVLVSETTTYYHGSCEKLVQLSGSVYGGNFNGLSKSRMICWLNYERFSGKNGEVRNATLQNAVVDGIHYGSSANNKPLGGAKAIGNVIRNCSANGISAVNGGAFSFISSNTIYKIGKGETGSGINITHANVSTISNNSISSTKGHGISTETDLARSMKIQKKITINVISGNKISLTGVHGIWVDKKVTINRIDKNSIKNSKKCGIAIEKNGKIKKFNKNTITRSKASNITMNGKKSYLKVGSGNKITKSKSIGIMVNAKATLIISGKNNVIKGNKNDIRVMKKKGAKFTFKNKKRNKIKKIRIV